MFSTWCLVHHHPPYSLIRSHPGLTLTNTQGDDILRVVEPLLAWPP